MENTIYLALSRQTVLKSQMDMVANNVANMNTPGFRSQHILFEEYISDPKKADDPLSFVYDVGQFQSEAPGPVTFTGNQMDIALEGPGYIGVQIAGGNTAYTRAGNFQLSADGGLMTSEGLPVADAGGAPINIPADSTEINIDKQGFISNQNGALGQIQIVEFANPENLEPIGSNLYTSAEPSVLAENTTVQQGMVEGSNVNPVQEMTSMIEILRSFQSTQQLIQGENERLRNAIRKLTES